MGFSADWLDLREPSDHAARDATLLATAAQCVPAGGVVMDLGSGTGSTARAFGPLLDHARWRFLDADADLLRLANSRHPGSETIVADLADVASLPLSGVDLVTASALLDLMPSDWIEALAARLRQENVPFYAALNYNGDMSWTEEDPEDGSITDAFNSHQAGNKGLGPATGPLSALTTQGIFLGHGYEVLLAESPWCLDSTQVDLQEQLLSGIAQAAGEAGHRHTQRWLAARRAALPRSQTRIGHTDVLAILR